MTIARLPAPTLHPLLAAAAVAFALVAVISPASAALIEWGTATGLSGDADVSTSGTPVHAANLPLGPTAGASVATTINGVAFASTLVSIPIASGNFTLSNAGTAYFTRASSPAFAALSPEYRQLLTGGTGGSQMTLTISDLMIDSVYEIQFFAHRILFGGVTTLTAGNTLFLDEDDGGVGQFGIGTFTADAATQTIAINGSINAVQLRLLPPPIPEPTTALFGAALLGVVGLHRRRRALA